MRRVIGAIVGAGLVLSALLLQAAPAAAQTPPPVGTRAGATLLLPYFEVDLDNAAGATTLFSVNNASATAVLAHIVVWSDMGVPVFTFNSYLTGYDMQAFNLRDILTGHVPVTASAGQDPTDRLSPKGPYSQDINFASCSGILPPPADAPEYVDYLRSALTGGASTFHGGQCVGQNLGTAGIARGYVTVDTVNNCTLRLPGEAGYLESDLTFQNVLYGDYQYVTPGSDTAYGDSLVQITAALTDPQLDSAGDYTFYGHRSGWSAADHREPLGTKFVARFVAPKDFKTAAKARRKPFLPAGTELVVWRDPKVRADAFACGTAPSWYPLQQEQILVFNEQERYEAPAGVNPFPAVAQRISLTDATLPTTFANGFLYLDLNNTVPSAPTTPTDAQAAQAWVSVLHHVQQGPNGGHYDAGYRAIRLESARNTTHSVIP